MTNDKGPSILFEIKVFNTAALILRENALKLFCLEVSGAGTKTPYMDLSGING